MQLEDIVTLVFSSSHIKVNFYISENPLYLKQTHRHLDCILPHAAAFTNPLFLMGRTVVIETVKVQVPKVYS